MTAAQGMEQVAYPDGEIRHQVYPLVDSKSENIQQFFIDFFMLVEEEIAVGSVLVHCAAGVSRVCFWLVIVSRRRCLLHIS